MVNGNIVLTAHARNEYVQKRQRCVECDCDQIVEVFLSETVIPLQCRMLEQGVGRDLKDGSPVSLDSRTSRSVWRRSNVKLKLTNPESTGKE